VDRDTQLRGLQHQGDVWWFSYGGSYGGLSLHCTDVRSFFVCIFRFCLCLYNITDFVNHFPWSCTPLTELFPYISSSSCILAMPLFLYFTLVKLVLMFFSGVFGFFFSLSYVDWK